MVKISIIGSGNVAQHLITAFLKSSDTDIVQVFSRNPQSVAHILPYDKITDDYNNLAEADLYIISVSDVAVGKVSEKLPFKNRLVAHTSGSLPMDIIDKKNRCSVFYPVQTFSASRPIEFSEIPVCIEADDDTDYRMIEKAAMAISHHVIGIDSRQRKALHVAAVFVNNFTNHLYKKGADICNSNDIPFEILKPLIHETAAKITMLSPEAAQTGPAIRHDQNTIDAHLAFLNDDNTKNIYQILTKSIQHDA